jgi:hypothetical protein
MAARFFKFGLIVTGEGEAKFLPVLLRSLTAAGDCHFRVLRKIDQRSPRTSPKRVLRVTGTTRRIPDKDEHEIGLPARRHLDSDRDALVLVIDDLERARRGEHRACSCGTARRSTESSEPTIRAPRCTF